MDVSAPEMEDPRHAKARAEVALICALVLLIAAGFMVLLLGDTRIAPRRFAFGAFATMVFLPGLLLKGALAEKRSLGIAVCILACAIGGYVGTFSLPVALATTLLGAAAGYLFYRIRQNTAYRPRLLGE